MTGTESQPLIESEVMGREEVRKPTDDELTDLLIEQWGGRYRFMFGMWHRYEGGMWYPDQRIAIHFWNVLIQNKYRGIKPNAGKAGSVEKYAQLRAIVEDNEMDSGDNWVNLQNGVFNLTTYQLEAHQEAFYMTSQLPFAYDKDAKCPTWERFLNSTLRAPNGVPDVALIHLVQEAFGYSLTADTAHRASFWLVGASGTGKSTLLNVLIALAGNTHVGIDLDSLKDNQYQLADIAGKRIVTFTEPDSRSVLADGWYKRLVSKDVISARQAYGKPFNFVPKCKLWGAMNDTPRVADRSDAVFSRVVIIPMNYIVPPNERDRQLDEKLRGELAGIFNWAMNGLRFLRYEGKFTPSTQSEAAREQYRAENDPERLFVEERCEQDANHWVKAETLYLAYRVWCVDNGYQPKSSATVSKDWRRLGFVADRNKAYRFWRGVKVIDRTA